MIPYGFDQANAKERRRRARLNALRTSEKLANRIRMFLNQLSVADVPNADIERAKEIIRKELY